MNLHKCAIATIRDFADLMLGERPAKQPLGFLRAHVDTAMAHRRAEIVVSVGAMEGVTLGREEARPGDTGELVIFRVGKEIAVAHVLGRVLFQNMEVALGCFGIFAGNPGGNRCFEYLFIIFIRHQGLHS